MTASKQHKQRQHQKQLKKRSVAKIVKQSSGTIHARPKQTEDLQKAIELKLLGGKSPIAPPTGTAEAMASMTHELEKQEAEKGVTDV